MYYGKKPLFYIEIIYQMNFVLSNNQYKLAQPLYNFSKNVYCQPNQRNISVSSFRRLVNYCSQKMFKKHNSERQFYHLELINNILNIDQQNQIRLGSDIRIRAIDQKFNDQYEYLSKYYKNNDSTLEMIQLTTYFKYYFQSPTAIGKEHFRVIFIYNENKKQLNYKLLKKMVGQQYFTATQTFVTKDLNRDTNVKDKEYKLTKDLTNILGELSSSQISQQEKNQSACFIKLKQNLINKYGKSKQKDISEVDKKYQFEKKWIEIKNIDKLAWQKKRTKRNLQLKLPKKCIRQQSTNSTSYQNMHSQFAKTQQTKQLQNKKKDNKNYLKLNQKLKSKQNKIQRLKTLYHESKTNDYRLSLQGNGLKDNKEKFKIKRRSCQNIERIKFQTFSNESKLNNRYVNNNRIKKKENQLQKLYKVKPCEDLKNKKSKNNKKIKTSSCQNINKIYRKSEIDDCVECYRTSLNSIRREITYKSKIQRQQNKNMRLQGENRPNVLDKYRKRKFADKSSSQLQNVTNKGKIQLSTIKNAQMIYGNKKSVYGLSNRLDKNKSQKPNGIFFN